ncbi:hypothetical protein Pen02_62920 [Plantactinospora endophytica]|uniref:Uncharacterized protein n=1 Tax=Plantactinospora endophytica TaxID=673535 RepID=A0ABQ4E9L1_9ACTN|nr:hypothetical protein Pen02_62920 [Plantactinospora endophytica]
MDSGPGRLRPTCPAVAPALSRRTGNWNGAGSVAVILKMPAARVTVTGAVPVGHRHL